MPEVKAPGKTNIHLATAEKVPFSDTPNEAEHSKPFMSSFTFTVFVAIKLNDEYLLGLH